MTVTEEKKLDDKTLEDVSGGEIMPAEEYRRYKIFCKENCNSCRRWFFDFNCPYGTSSKAFQTLGAGAICPEREAK